MAEDHNTFSVTSNEFEFSFSQADIAAADLIKRSEAGYHLLYQNQSVKATVIPDESDSKKLSITLDGEIFTVRIREELDLMLDQMGFNTVSAKHIKEIKAPMPGLVLDISVTEGQEVQEGDKILILEAMKMENSIQALAAAKIKKIHVSPGQAVDKGQVLIELV